MRILKLRFNNINSLAGEWEIDFRHRAFSESGIFAITGPTGAGKSTILDAICLALYGCTPRLRTLSVTENEAMTRLTSECWSEVTFETQAGTYRCMWYQRRARGKADGNLQPARHEIVDARTDAVLEDRLLRVKEKVRDVTGMDLEQFMRSMLLAQGQFAAFLQADANTRGELLEKISGTSIYTTISKCVYERTSEEKEALRTIDIALGAMQMMDEEERARCIEDLNAQRAEAAAMSVKLSELRTMAGWHEAMLRLEQSLAEAERDCSAYAGLYAQAEPDRNRLAAAMHAASLDQLFIPLMKLRGETQLLRQSIGEKRQRLPDVQDAWEEAKRCLDEARSQRARLEADLQLDAVQWKKVRELDTTIREKRNRHAAAVRTLGEHGDELRAQNEAIETLRAELDRIRAEGEDIRSYLDEHACDASLVETTGAIGMTISSIHERRRQLEQKRARLDVVDEEWARHSDTVAEARTACERMTEAARAAEAAASEIDARLREILRGRDVSELRGAMDVLAEREANLSDLMRQLKEYEETDAALKEEETKREELAVRRSNGSRIKEAAEEEKKTKQKEAALCEEIVLLARTIDSLSAHRAALRDGEACPLCGATEHPFAHGQTPQTDEKQLALDRAKAELEEVNARLLRYSTALAKIEGDIENSDTTIAKQKERRAELDRQARGTAAALASACTMASAKEALERVRAQKADVQQAIIEADRASAKQREAQETMQAVEREAGRFRLALEKAEGLLGRMEHERGQLNDDLAHLKEELAQLMEDLGARIAPYGIAMITGTSLEAVSEELDMRKRAWEQRSAQRVENALRESALASDIQSAEAVREKIEGQAAKCGEEVESSRAAVNEAESERRRLFGGRDPDEEERTMTDRIATLGRSIALHEKESERRSAERTSLEKELALLEERLAACATALETDEAAFGIRLAEAGFVDEMAFSTARLDDTDRAALAQRMEAMRDEGTRLESLRTQKREELERERNRNVTSLSPGDVSDALAGTEARRTVIDQSIGALESTLQEDARQQSAHADKREQRERRLKEYQRWSALNELIGSADGKKFRKVAQAVTFELMVAQANQVLRKMSPRYILMRDPDTELDLSIIDQYQAGEIRSTKNLSGGESFIVSLSLALGLSHMAGRNVRVDSLFLDEGFGTLDEDALDTALTTLAELQQEGKTIGVISHVSALKERITTQITVTPEAGGRSSLSGPGCRRVG